MTTTKNTSERGNEQKRKNKNYRKQHALYTQEEGHRCEQVGLVEERVQPRSRHQAPSSREELLPVVSSGISKLLECCL